MTATCPECGAQITLGPDAVVGDTAVCHECAAVLEVSAVGPLELELEGRPEGPPPRDDWGQ